MKATAPKETHLQKNALGGMPPIARPLGKMERSMWFFDQSTPTNICVGCDVTGQITDAGLREAVRWCQIRYPMLRTVVRLENKDLYFACYGASDAPGIRIDISEGTPEEEDRIVEDELRVPLDGMEGLMFKVKLVRTGKNRSFLSVVFNHLIGDGSSGVVLMRDLLTVLGHQSCSATVAEPVALSFPPVVEDGIPMEHKGFKGLKKFLGFQKEFLAKTKELGGQPSPIRTQKDVPAAGRKVKIKSFRLTEAETLRFIEVAKREKVTPYALLSACMLDAKRPLLERDEKQSDQHSRVVSFASPTDLRPFLKVSTKEHFGFYASAINHLYKLEEENDIPALARQLQSDIKGSLFKRKLQLHLTPFVAKFLGIRLFFPVNAKGVARMAKFTDKMFKTCAASLTYISNPRVEPQIGELTIGHARGHIAPSIMGVCLYSVVLYNNALTVYLNYNDEQFSDADAELLNDRFNEAIRRMLDLVVAK